jgi:hypothetical protein
MRLFRTLLVGGAAAVLGGSVALSVTATTPTAAPREHAVNAHLTAAFLAQARSALVTDLRTPGVALFPQGRPSPHASSAITDITSYNWAGYADSSTTTGEFTQVSGAWTVPSVTCTKEDRITSDWVGLDGLTSSTVEQDGTVSQCFEGDAIYYSWYEMYPAGTIEVGATVAAGDKISASVARSGANYTLALTDSTNTANSFTESASCAVTTCLDTSAEWIAERPAYSIGIVPEAQFSKVTFTAGSTVAGGKTDTIGSGPSPDSINCIDATDTYNLVTTNKGLTGGNSFSSDWNNSY